MRPLLSALTFLACVASAVPAYATTYTYQEQATSCGGVNPRLWSNTGCWSPSGVPGAADTAIVGLDPGSNGVSLQADGVTVLNLTLTGTDDGQLVGAGFTIATGGTFTWGTGGAVGENLTVPVGATMVIASSGDRQLADQTIFLQGTGTWTEGSLSIVDDAVFRNEGTLTVTANAASFGSVQATADFYNSGTLDVTGPGTFTDASGGWGFHNSGIVTLTGNPTVEWRNSGNTNHTLDGGGRITGAGTVLFDEPTSGGSNVLLTGGTQTIGTDVTLVLGNGSSLGGSGTLAGAGTVTLEGVSVTTSSTAVDGGPDTQPITFGTPVSIPPNSLGDGGAAGITVLDPGTSGINFTGTTTLAVGPLEIAESTVTNSGTWTVTQPTILQENSSDATLLNQGTFVANPGTGKFEMDATFTNAGTFEVESATTLFVFYGYTQTAGTTAVSSGATLVANETSPPTAGDDSAIDIQGGSLTGSGTVRGLVTSEATVAPGSSGAAGKLSITGPYTQSSTGTLSVALGGTTAGTQFDVLAVSGDVTLAGALDVTLLGGYVPVVDNSYEIITAGGGAADVGTFSGGTQPAGVTLSTTYGTDSVVLGIVSVSMPDAGPADAGTTTEDSGTSTSNDDASTSAPDGSAASAPDASTGSVSEDAGGNLDEDASTSNGNSGGGGGGGLCSLEGPGSGGPFPGLALFAAVAILAARGRSAKRRERGAVPSSR